MIDAHRDYYGIDQVPEFWEWLVHQGLAGSVKILPEIHDEIHAGKDRLARWVKEGEVKRALLLDEEANGELVTRVVYEGYAADLTDSELEEVGRDPFLIAYALADPAQRCVVTTESSKPKRRRANRHIPDVCHDLGIRCCTTFTMTRELGFRTDWGGR